MEPLVRCWLKSLALVDFKELLKLDEEESKANKMIKKAYMRQFKVTDEDDPDAQFLELEMLSNRAHETVDYFWSQQYDAYKAEHETALRRAVGK